MKPMPRLSSTESVFRSCPQIRIWPAVGGRIPAIVLSVVVLPAPLGPTSPRISPGWTSNDRFETASNPSYCLHSPSTESIGTSTAAEYRTALRYHAPMRGARVFPLAAVVSLAVLSIAVGIHPLTNNDIWLHLTTGREIVEHGAIP